MTEIGQVYKCEICGNIVEVVHAGVGVLVCCGQPMVLMSLKAEEEGYEKHLPVLEKKGETVHIKVGSVEHPMVEKHYIEWIAVDTEDGTLRRFLKPGEKPETTFTTKGRIVQAREYCSLHGHWVTKA